MNEDQGKDYSGDLRLLSARIRGMGWLIATQPKHCTLPLDLDEIFWGIGSIIEELGEEALEISRIWEKDQLRWNGD